MIYVDKFPSGWGKWSGGGHMLCTDIEELHWMATKIGLKPEWFQDKTFPHYDVQKRKRELAIQNGAVEIEFGHIPEDVLMRCHNGSYETRHERRARVHAAKAR